MADEKRIVEIVVKTVGEADVKKLAAELAAIRKESTAARKSLQDAERGVKELGNQAAQSQAQLREMNETMNSFGHNLKKIGSLIGVGFTIKGLIQASDEMQKLNDRVQHLAASFVTAAFAAAGFSDALDNDAAWKAVEDHASGIAEQVTNFATALPKAVIGVGELGAKLAELYRDVRAAPSLTEGLEKFSKDNALTIRDPLLQQSLDTLKERGEEVGAKLGEAAAAGLPNYTKILENRAAFAKRQEQFRKEDAAAAKKALDEAAAAALDWEHQQQQAFGALARDVAAGEAQVAKAANDEFQKAMQNRKDWQADSEAQVTSFEQALKLVAQHMEYINELQGDLLTQAVAWGDALTYAFKGVLTGELHNTRDLLRSITAEMRDFYAELAARAAAKSVLNFISGLLGSISGLSGASHMTGGLYADAKGDAFSRGAVVPFARGGIVGGPTLFPMANGMGLMGEAGPEAVMPLKRGPDGKLGVQAAHPKVVVENHGPPMTASLVDEGDEMRIVLRAANLGASMAQERINRSVRTGYGQTAQNIQGSYGLRRRG
jgi:hypothetical protein